MNGVLYVIVVYGTGKAARSIAQALACGGYPVRIVGRNKEHTALLGSDLGLDYAVAPTNALDHALKDVWCVVNAAGPFITTFDDVCSAAIRNSCHYLDISNEYGIYALAEKHASQAHELGLSILPGMGFGVAAVQLAVAKTANTMEPLYSLDIIVFTPNTGDSTPGVRKTMSAIVEMGPHAIENSQLRKLSSRRLASILNTEGDQTPEAIPFPTGALEALSRTTRVPNITVRYPTKPQPITQASITVRVITQTGTRYENIVTFPDHTETNAELIRTAMQHLHEAAPRPGALTPGELLNMRILEQLSSPHGR